MEETAAEKQQRDTYMLNKHDQVANIDGVSCFSYSPSSPTLFPFESLLQVFPLFILFLPLSNIVKIQEVRLFKATCMVNQRVKEWMERKADSKSKQFNNGQIPYLYHI